MVQVDKEENKVSNVKSMSHGALAARLKLLCEQAAATPVTLAETGEEEPAVFPLMVDAEMVKEIEEASKRLSTLDMGQQMSAAMNLNYTDEALAGMSDQKIAQLLGGQSTSLRMATGVEGETVEMSVHGDGCLLQRLAKEASKRLDHQAAKQIGEDALKEFVKNRAEEVKPFRPE